MRSHRQKEYPPGDDPGWSSRIPPSSLVDTFTSPYLLHLVLVCKVDHSTPGRKLSRFNQPQTPVFHFHPTVMYFEHELYNQALNSCLGESPGASRARAAPRNPRCPDPAPRGRDPGNPGDFPFLKTAGSAHDSALGAPIATLNHIAFGPTFSSRISFPLPYSVHSFESLAASDGVESILFSPSCWRDAQARHQTLVLYRGCFGANQPNHAFAGACGRSRPLACGILSKPALHRIADCRLSDGSQSVSRLYAPGKTIAIGNKTS